MPINPRVRAQRLSGINPLAYVGVDPVSPTNFVILQRAPTTQDYYNFNEGDEWLDSTTNDVWKLVNKDAQVATWVMLSGGSGGTINFIEDSGTATPSGGDLNVLGSTNINTAGAGNTVTINLNDSLTGLTSIDVTDITADTINTGDLIADYVETIDLVVTGTTDLNLGLGVVQSAADGTLSATNGTNGQVIIAKTGDTPIWANLTAGANITITNAANAITIAATGGGGGVTTIEGNTGGTVTGAVTLITANATPTFVASGGDTETLDFGLSNLALGSSLASITTGVRNAAFGSSAFNSATSSTDSVAIGYNAGTLVTTGANNTLVGSLSGSSLTTGASNIIIGKSSGSAYVSSESSNLIIGNTGTAAESNVLRIGTSGSSAGQQNKAYIAGVNGVNVGSVATVVSISGDQLGTTTLTAGSNITITPGAGTITIDTTGGASYSTGTFTPVLTFAGGTTGITYSLQEGFYTKIGNLVAIYIEIRLSSKGSSVGGAYITGLPFTKDPATGDIDVLMTGISGVTYPAGYVSLHGAIDTATNRLYANATGSGVAKVNLTNTAFTNTAVIKFQGTYFAS